MGIIVIFIVAAIPLAIGIKIFLWSVDYLIAPVADFLESLVNKSDSSDGALKGTITITYVASEQKK